MGGLIRFSANLGFLWSDRPLPAAIGAAARAGFAAVECHWPYDTDAGAVRAALEEAGLPMLALNTARGETGTFGLSALPGREVEARAAIDAALAYADAVGAGAVHVMAGNAAGPAAEDVFLENLRYACERAGDQMILIEPINAHDAPDYFLRTTNQAAGIIARLGAPNLKMMFDCYHVGRTEGDVIDRLQAHIGIIGHIQFAGVPDRGPPDRGALDYAAVFRAIAELGWDRPLGAEYRPGGETDATLDWMTALV